MPIWIVECTTPGTHERTTQRVEANSAEDARALMTAAGYNAGVAYIASNLSTPPASSLSLMSGASCYRGWMTMLLAIAGGIVIAAGLVIIVRTLGLWVTSPRADPSWPYIWALAEGLGLTIGGTMYWGVAHVASTVHHSAQDIVLAIRESRGPAS